ncbi:MAG: hypothetical protein UY41_C0002G0029 [Candidatus Moranbacteria bacterium GW2011_GWE1_49_15]|nr:MAG: hypothetical protein UX75_C0003G0028 [Candidatus Moranbacteria bacterium GW2011_GWE2_47_10]KKW07512.1 MAG: hypothetical protein UY41_C0002G0029 [Candidatus Moranbacteria bacterium GW2011_GWE1_49_15]
MLYYIVPPIIIVVGTASLIFFLFRKFSGMEMAGELQGNLNAQAREERNGSRIGIFLSQLWLRILERMMQRTKLFSLKMHNASNNWFHSIKNKRESIGMEDDGRDEARAEEVASESAVQARAEVIEKAAEQKVEAVIRRTPKTEGMSIRQRMSRSRLGLPRKEKVELAKPPMEKNRLEDALIKRIAVNPKDIEAYERLGDYYSDMKNFKDAVECFKQVIKLGPSNTKAKIKLKNLERILKR